MSIHLGDDDELPAATRLSNVMTAADYYRRAERGTSDYRQSNVERTKHAAGDILARMTAVRWFDEVSRDTMLISRDCHAWRTNRTQAAATATELGLRRPAR